MPKRFVNRQRKSKHTNIRKSMRRKKNRTSRNKSARKTRKRTNRRRTNRRRTNRKKQRGGSSTTATGLSTGLVPLLQKKALTTATQPSQDLMSKIKVPIIKQILIDFKGIAEKFGESENSKFATLAANIKTKSLDDLLRNKKHLVFGIVKLNEIQLFLKHLSAKGKRKLLDEIHANLGNSGSSLTIYDIMKIISHMGTIMNYAWDFDGELTELTDMSLLTNKLTELTDMSLLTNKLKKMTQGSSGSRSRDFPMKGGGDAAVSAGAAHGAAPEEVTCAICRDPVNLSTDPNLCINLGHNCHLGCYIDWFSSRKNQEATGHLNMPAGKSCFNCPLCNSDLDPEKNRDFLEQSRVIEEQIAENIDRRDHEFAVFANQFAAAPDAAAAEPGRVRQIARWISYLMGFVFSFRATQLALELDEIEQTGGTIPHEQFMEFFHTVVAICVCVFMYLLTLN